MDMIKINKYINNSMTIAVRMASSNALQDLIIKTKSPIFMTSANKSEKSPITTLDEIEKEFPTLDGILEGNVTFGMSSTIVDCTLEPIKILREGPITKEQIMELLKN